MFFIENASSNEKSDDIYLTLSKSFFERFLRDGIGNSDNEIKYLISTSTLYFMSANSEK